MKILNVILFLFFQQTCFSQIVTTIYDSVGVNLRDDIILDDYGNIYCSDYGGTNVYKLTPEGSLSIFISGLETPNGLAFDSEGNLFICDNIGNRIYKVNSAGVFLDTFEVNKPSGIIKEFDSDTLIFTEYGETDRLSKLSPDGEVVSMHTGDPLNGPVGLAYDNAGQLYVANFNDRKIFKASDDTLIYLATVPGPPSGALGFLAFGGNKLWGTSWGSTKIYGIGTSMTDSTFLYCGSEPGGTDGTLEVATFTSPNGIYSNITADTIYVSEYNTGKLRRIAPDYAGIKNESEINNLFSIYPNPSTGSIIILNNSNNDIKKVEVINSLGKVEQQLSLLKNSSYNFVIEQKGLFIVRVTLNNNEVITKKVLISN